jgi:hypothetical protein
LSNFIVEGDRVYNIDTEWVADGPVSENLVAWRALWYFALGHLTAGRTTPWGSVLQVDLLCSHLATVAGCPATIDDLDRMRSAEGALQQLVIGRDPQDQFTEMTALGRLTPIDVAARAIPVSKLQAALASLYDDIEKARQTEAVLLNDIRTLLLALDSERSTVGELRAQLAELDAPT